MKAIIVLTTVLSVAFAQGFFRSPHIDVVQRTDVRDYAGQFSSSYTGSDGTHVSETGALKPTLDRTDNVLVKQGSYRYTSPEGNTYQVQYTADENGFHPEGAHFPIPPAELPPTF